MSTATVSEHLLKVRKIFDLFDVNRDGHLDRREVAALVVSLNPDRPLTDKNVGHIVDGVFEAYADFVAESQGGLSFDGLLRTYDDGAGNVDRDFDALCLDLGDDYNGGGGGGGEPPSTSVSITVNERRLALDRPVYPTTLRLNTDLVGILKRMELKLALVKRGASCGAEGKKMGPSLDFSEEWSKDFVVVVDGGGGGGGARQEVLCWDELGPEFEPFRVEIKDIQYNASRTSLPTDEAYDAHMAIGRTLAERGLMDDALISFGRAADHQPTDPRPHFHRGNAHYASGRIADAREAFEKAREAAETDMEMDRSLLALLLPQIHVNLGVVLEAEGMLWGARAHYERAVALDPGHARAWKHLGSAAYGAGEYRCAEHALSEAVRLDPAFADAHCDLGSALLALGDGERAVREYQTAIDLKPGHVDALYNLGGVHTDAGCYALAADVYAEVLALQPDNWRAQLNRSVALLGAGKKVEAVKSFKQALRMTNRVEMYDVVFHLEQVESSILAADADTDADAADTDGSKDTKAKRYIVVQPVCFTPSGPKTTDCQCLALALGIRRLQKHTRLSGCDVTRLLKESPNVDGDAKSIKKVDLEKRLGCLLQHLSPDTFQGAVKAINERILSILDGLAGSGGLVDLGMFYAIVAPICAGPLELRKQTAFDALLWRSSSPDNGGNVSGADVSLYIKLLRAIYLSSQEASGLMEYPGEDDQGSISYPEFVKSFDCLDWGFGISQVLVKLETADRVRHGKLTCSVCLHPIIGLRFKEVNAGFSLCSLCYSECKVPASAARCSEYFFREYANQVEALKDWLPFFRTISSSPPPD